MTTLTKPACKLCGDTGVKPAYQERWRGVDYTGYYCAKCDVYETIGDIADVSPQYHSLTENEIQDQYVFQSSVAHKGEAFRQWRNLMIDKGGPLRGSLLDIGCGIGGFLGYAAEQGVECYGFDAAAPQVAYANKTHPNVTQAVTMTEYLTKVKKRDFRYFTMWDVLEHIPAPVAMLSSVRQAMSTDSLLYISVPSGGTINMKKAYYKVAGKELSLCPWEHVFYYTPKSLRDVLERSGLRVLEIGGVEIYKRPISASEVIRRIVTKGLANTRFATQLFAVVARE